MRPALLFRLGEVYPGPGACSESELHSAGLPSLFGSVNFHKLGQGWPHCQGVALYPVLQLNLLDLPFKPKALANVSALTFFLHPSPWPARRNPKELWCLRTYSRSDKLERIENPNPVEQMKPHLLQEPELVEDYPDQSTPEFKVEEETWNRFKNDHPSQSGIKLGGWPLLSPSEPDQSRSTESILQLTEIPQWPWFAGLSVEPGTPPAPKKNWGLRWHQ